MSEPQEGYKKLNLNVGGLIYNIYVPAPINKLGTPAEVDTRLVRSVLEAVVAQCPIMGIRVNGDRIILSQKSKRNGRSGVSMVENVPTFDDVVDSLVEVGYRRISCQDHKDQLMSHH